MTRTAPFISSLPKWALVGLILGAGACNATSPETPAIGGTWRGAVAAQELDLEVVLNLVDVGRGDVQGVGELSSIRFGTVEGDVSGFVDGLEVDLTIEIEGVIVAGSVVFEGVFEDDRTILGQVSSGLIGGQWALTLEKQ